MGAAMPSPPWPLDRALRVGTRGSPLALIQTRAFVERLRSVHPAPWPIEERPIRTTGDSVQNRRLAEVGGKGLFAKEIHEALADRRVDCAVHSLKDLETGLPAGIVLACVLPREDARDALVLGREDAPIDPAAPFAGLPPGASIGTASVRRQAQLLHARPDLAITTLRGNVQTRLDKLEAGACAATLLACAGLTRLGLAGRASAVLDPDVMVPAAGQGIIAVTAREEDTELRELLSAVEDPDARAVATAERALLMRLDGSCRTPIGGHARHLPNGELHLMGLVARGDGSFLLKRSLHGAARDALRIGTELGAFLRADSPDDIFA
jgi:hydroxymethylbilane synthase